MAGESAAIWFILLRYLQAAIFVVAIAVAVIVYAAINAACMSATDPLEPCWP